jgi:hypothetical protein
MTSTPGALIWWQDSFGVDLALEPSKERSTRGRSRYAGVVAGVHRMRCDSSPDSALHCVQLSPSRPSRPHAPGRGVVSFR